MTDEEYGKRYTDLVRLYRANPSAFSEDDLDNIEYLAKSLGRRFSRDPQSIDESLGTQVTDVIKQFGSGLISGFTTLPVGDDPDDVGESIARSLGQLAGFLGYIPGAGMITKAGFTAAGKILSKTAGLAYKSQKILPGRAAAKIKVTGSALSKKPGMALTGLSIPMYIGSKALKASQKYVLPKTSQALAKKLSQSTVDNAIDALESAIHLGSASAVSSWTGGIDQMIKGGLLGAVEGGVFRGITNATQLGQLFSKGGADAAKANLAVRTLSSSLYGGLQSRSFGDPIELQIYHYLLGAFFGYTDVPFTQRKTIQFINKSFESAKDDGSVSFTEWSLNPEKMPGFKDLNKDVQEEVRDQLLFRFGKPGDASALFAQALGENMSKERREELKRELSRRIYEQKLDEGLNEEDAREATFKEIEGKEIEDLANRDQIFKYFEESINSNYIPLHQANDSFTSKLNSILEDHQIPTTIRDPLVMWTDQMSSVLSKVDPDMKDKIEEQLPLRALAIAKEMQASAKKGRSFEEFASRTEKKTGYKLLFENRTDDPSTLPSSRLLRKAYKAISQERPIRQMVFNPKAEGNFSLTETADGILSDQKRIAESAAPSALKRAVSLSNRDILSVKYTDDGKKTGKLFQHFFDRNDQMNVVRVRDFVLNAAKMNKPVLLGKKDSGTVYVSDGWLFNDKTNDWALDFYTKVRDIKNIDADFKIDDVYNSIIEGQEVFKQDFADLDLTVNEINRAASQMQQDALIENITKKFQDGTDYNVTIGYKYIYNTIKLLENFNGLSIQEMVRANKEARNAGKSEPFIIKPADINKRAQPLADGNPSISKSVGKMRAAIVSGTDIDVAKDLDINLDEVGSDGVFLVNEQYFDKLALDSGANPDAGFLKFTINSNVNDGRGLIIGKLGAFKASGTAQKLMNDNKLDGLFFDTAVKQRGLREIGKLEINTNGAKFKEGLDIFDINPEDIRINLGVYEKMPKNIRIVKQLLSTLTDPAARKRIMESIIRPSIEGDKELNKKYNNNKLTDEDIANLDVEQLSVGNIMDIIFQPNSDRIYATPLYKKVMRHILDSSNDDNFIDPDIYKGENNGLDEILGAIGIDSFNGPSDRKIKIASAINELSPLLLDHYKAQSYVHQVVKKYITNRAIRPIVDNSGTAFIYGNDPLFQFDNANVKPGTYVFGKSMRNFKIKWIDGNETTMGKAWDLYQKEQDSFIKKQMEDALEFVFVRVPQDSPSGARVLKFTGFSDRAGYGVHLSDIDMKYIGGADNDGDKTHFFQSLDGDLEGSPVRDAIYNIRNQWDDGQGGVLDAKRNLDLRWKQSGKDIPAPKTPADGLNVAELIKTHLYTTLGNQNVGTVANKTALATAFRGLFKAKDKTLLDIDIPESMRQNGARFVRINKIDETLLDFNDINREQLNVSVDATDRLPYTRAEAAKISSDAIVKGFKILDENGKVINKKNLPKDQLAKISGIVDFSATRGSKGLSSINNIVQNKKYVQGRPTNVSMDEFASSMFFFNRNYANKDLGNAYWEGLMALSDNIRGKYKASNLDPYKGTDVRKSPESLSRAVKFNTNKLFNVINRFLSDSKDITFSEMLSSSGLSNISILKPSVDDFRTFSESRQIYDSIESLTSLSLNYDTYQAAKKTGTSDKKLRGIRKHVDAIKYMYSKMYSIDKNSPSYTRNIILKDEKLGLKSIKSMEELLSATESYRNKLKTKEEKDYYDSYMLGSLSEQRLNIDDIAKYEYAISMGKAKNYAEAENVITNPDYEHITFDYINSEQFKRFNENDPRLNGIADKVDRIHQGSNHNGFGFTLPFVNDSMVAKFIKEANDLAQAKESDIIFNDGSDPRLSRIVEDLLLRHVNEDLASKLRSEVKNIAKDYRFRNIEEGTNKLSFISFFDKNNSVREPINEKEARDSAIADEPIRQEMTTELIEKILKAPQAKIVFDESTQYGRRNKSLLEGLKQHMSKMPSNVVDYFNKVYENKIQKELDVSSTQDLENFLLFVDTFHKKTFLENLTGSDINKKISGIYYLFFPEAIGRRLTSADANLSPDRVIQVLTKDGYKSKEVQDVMSTFEMIRRTLSATDENKSSIINLVDNKINEELSYLNDESIIKDRNDLFEIAITIHELPNINYYANRLKNESLTKEKEAELKDSIKKFGEMFRSREAKYNELKDKEYVIYDADNVKKVVTGKDLMGEFGHVDSTIIKKNRGRISKSIESLNKFFYNSFINPPEAELFVVRRNDGSMDAIATIRKMQNQFENARYEGERIPNIGLSNLIELSREINYLYNTEAVTKDGTRLIKDIEDINEREQALFRVRMSERGIYAGDGPNGKEYQRDESGRYKLTPIIGKFKFDEYFPHLNHSDDAFNEHAEKYYLSKGADEATYSEFTAFKRWWTQGKLDDSGIAREHLEDLFKVERFHPDAKKRSDNTRFNKQGNLGGRTDRILGEWSVGINDYSQYAQSLNSGYHKMFGVIMGQEYNRRFRESKVMGDMTESWAKFGDIYIQDFTGKPSSFPREYFEDPGLNLRRSPYYALSDDGAQYYYNKIADKFGWKKFEESNEVETLEFQAKLQTWSRLEGKAQLMTLLSNTTSMTNNYAGGNFQTAISTGFRPWRRAHNWRWMRDNIDPSINSSAKATEIAMKFGATESYLRGEISAINQLKSNGSRFIEEIAALHKSGDWSRKEAMDIARKNGLSDILAGPSAWMMSKVETELRTKAFWAHYIQARETMMADGVAFRWDDPMLIQQALKGVWASQFLYNAPNRPAIARTNLGRIFTRFQLWSWNSIKFRRDIISEARNNGFTEGTAEYDRFRRMAQADAFVFALAAMMPISMFGNILPAPWSYLEEFTAYFFGDEEERDKAFFGQIPYPFNPIQIALPPSSRYITTGISVPIEMAIAMLSDKDLSDALDYRVTSLIPYGNLARNLSRSIQNPVMAPQFLTGIPFTTINRMQNKMQESATLKTNGLFISRSRYVDEEIQELLDFYEQNLNE